MESSQFYSSIIISIVLYISGGFGNTISIIIFTNKEFIKQPSTVYLIGTFSANIIHIILVPAMMLISLWQLNVVNCKIFFGSVVILSELEAWLLTMCSVDRLITVMLPHKFLFKNTSKFQLRAIGLMFIIILVLITPFMFHYNTDINTQNKTLCSFPHETDLLWAFFYFKTQFLLFRAVLPFSIMIISSIVTVWKIVKNKNRLNMVRNHNNKKEIQLAKSLVAMDLFFIAFRLPLIFYVSGNRNDVDRIIFSFEYSLIMAVGSLNNAFLFLVFIIFNKVYRDLFFKYMRCKNNKVASIETVRAKKR
jgi:hypothetical protein